jgi:TonB family protein
MSLSSKFPGRTSGNLAFACSLFLHAVLIVVFSAWQWDLSTAPKSQPKVVKIKFLPPPTAQKDIPKPAPVKRAHFSPGQPVSVSSPSIPALTARTPRESHPAQQPVTWVKQTSLPLKNRSLTRRIQPVSISDTGTKSLAVRPSKTIHHNHNAIRKTVVRPSPTLNRHPTVSIQAVAPVAVRSTGQLHVVQRRSPTQQAAFQNTPVKATQTASFIKASNSVVKNIHQRPIPDTLSIEAGLTAQKAVVPFTSSTESRTQLTALPREFPQNLSADRDGPESNLNALRGLFTGKVRQRIANAKHYPRIAKRRGMEGRPIIAFTLDRQGSLTKTNLERTSGYQLLDQAALEAVHQAAPYPEIPAELKTETYQFKLPISFKLK